MASKVELLISQRREDAQGIFIPDAFLSARRPLGKHRRFFERNNRLVKAIASRNTADLQI